MIVDIQEIDRCDLCANKRSIRVGGELVACPRCNGDNLSPKRRREIEKLATLNGYDKAER